MDVDYKNKLLQISHKDSAGKLTEGQESRRASIRRLLQKMQEGPVPDMNTDKEVLDEKENAILRQLEGLEAEEQPEGLLAKRKKSPPALPS